MKLGNAIEKFNEKKVPTPYFQTKYGNFQLKTF